LANLSILPRRAVRKLLGPVRGERLRKVVRRVQRQLTPISPDDLRRALDQALGEAPEALLAHSSLSACGRFTAGPGSVLDVLDDYAGTLALVTHSYSYPAQIGEPGPIFDPATTPSQNGALTNLFRQRPGAVRSIHSTHSLAAKGPLAQELTQGHYLLDSPTGPGTPYMRLIERNASALMLGVSFHSYTFFHSAEFDSGSPAAYQEGVLDRLRVIDETGQVREQLSRRQNWEPMRFAEAGELMEKKGLVRRVGLGREYLRYVPDTARAHDFLVERLRKHPDFLRQSCRTELY